MPRLGKKTLYLDLDALAGMEDSLSVLPGKPSLSSYLNDELPKLALKLDEAVKPFRPAPLESVLGKRLDPKPLESAVSKKLDPKPLQKATSRKVKPQVK